MSTWILIVIAAVVALIVLFIVVRLLRSCLPKIVIGLIVLAALAYVIYRYFVQ